MPHSTDQPILDTKEDALNASGNEEKKESDDKMEQKSMEEKQQLESTRLLEIERDEQLLSEETSASKNRVKWDTISFWFRIFCVVMIIGSVLSYCGMFVGAGVGHGKSMKMLNLISETPEIIAILFIVLIVGVGQSLIGAIRDTLKAKYSEGG